MDSIPVPSQTCLLAEVKANSGTVWGSTRFVAWDLADGGSDRLMVLDRHLEGSNYAFIDGHVKWLKREVASAPHTQNKAIRFFWPDSENP